MSQTTPLIAGKYYHIYHRGNNRENIFREDRNYRFFLKRYAKYILPIAYTYAYSLLPNHFHVAVRIKTEIEQRIWWEQTCEVSQTSQVFEPLKPSQQFSNFFNSYTRAFNRAYERSGSLFEGRFRRIEVTSMQYLTDLIIYIHRNAEKHGIVEDFRDWPYSSYSTIFSSEKTHLQRDDILFWFGDQYGNRHQQVEATIDISQLIADDWD